MPKSTIPATRAATRALGVPPLVGGLLGAPDWDGLTALLALPRPEVLGLLLRRGLAIQALVRETDHNPGSEVLA